MCSPVAKNNKPVFDLHIFIDGLRCSIKKLDRYLRTEFINFFLNTYRFGGVTCAQRYPSMCLSQSDDGDDVITAREICFAGKKQRQCIQLQ